MCPQSLHFNNGVTRRIFEECCEEAVSFLRPIQYVKAFWGVSPVIVLDPEDTFATVSKDTTAAPRQRSQIDHVTYGYIEEIEIERLFLMRNAL